MKLSTKYAINKYDIMSVREFAELKGVTPQNVTYLCQAGIIDYMIVGGTVKVVMTDLTKLYERRAL